MTELIAIEDYYPAMLAPRYGYGKPMHARILAELEKGTARYQQTLESFLPLTPQFLQIARDPDPQQPAEPAWLNGWFPGLDAIGVFGLVSTLRPRLFLEIGSGNSTRFAAKARALNSHETKIVSIDPSPRVEIDALCDEVVRAPLESVPLDQFERLAPGDVLFFDGSHRVLQNSDATVLFLEILPAVKPGVYVHIHDIFWPADYPAPWRNRYYSEQYMLGMLLLYGMDRFEIVLPASYIAWYTDLGAILNEVWTAPHLKGIERHGGSFWMRAIG